MQLSFTPWPSLFRGRTHPACRAVVIVPARDEEASLAATLDSLAAQVDRSGTPLPTDSFEILLLLNNCSDGSAAVARCWKREHPQVILHVAERLLPAEQAFVGTARRMLMDSAWHRLQSGSGLRAILSTDSDTLVREDWIAQNLAALEAGAEAVGGAIALKQGELQKLPHGVRRAYLRDLRYQRLVAQLEDRLDPQSGDPWPRHLQHFGASLACTPEVYARAGGMPAVTPLEDVAFVNALWRVGAILRHHPDVLVYTSSRLQGRVEIGLSGQLMRWHQMSAGGQVAEVQSAAWLAHRFRTLARLRRQALDRQVDVPDYLASVDCDRIIAETFRGRREGKVTQVNRSLRVMLRRASTRPS